MKFLSSEELKRRQKDLRDRIVAQESEQIIALSKKVNEDLEKISTTDPAAWYIDYKEDVLKDYSNIAIQEVFYALRSRPDPNYATEFQWDLPSNRIISAHIQW